MFYDPNIGTYPISMGPTRNSNLLKRYPADLKLAVRINLVILIIIQCSTIGKSPYRTELPEFY